MATTTATIDADAILAAIGSSSCPVYGLRVMTVYRDDVDAPAVGDVLPPSMVWDDGEPTDETLDGTSAVLVAENGADGSCEAWAVERALTSLDPYFGRWVVLLGASSSGGGEDIDEIVMRDARVLWVGDRGSARCGR